MKAIGIIPARMSASRFYGKPLHPILGMPMLEHVFIRAKMYKKWRDLVVATCDKEIKRFCERKGFPVVMTSSSHRRALDRVAEAANKLSCQISNNNLVVCVQGDEPMLEPGMISKLIVPFKKKKSIASTVLAMHITEESIWRNPDTVKIIHDQNNKVLYTSRSPIPYCKEKFSKKLFARRIYGIFAFKKKYLDIFVNSKETRLEKIESCDSNRILDLSFDQHISPFPSRKSFSVDSPSDIKLVEKYMKRDKIYKLYKNN